MQKASSLAKAKSLMISSLMLGITLIAVAGCQKSKGPSNASTFPDENKLNQIETRLDKLEKLIEANFFPSSQTDTRTPSGPIRSLTIRTGTEDDRLRIYWSDGSKSDLPCTKEQLIWACG